MKAIILAAGRGRRLGAPGEDRPKVLLRFAGRSLLERHVAILERCGITQVAVVVGYRAELVRAEIAAIGRSDRVSFIDNPRYTEGSVVSLWSACSLLVGDGPVLLMDGDVLYDWRLMARLVRSPLPSCLLMDREIEPGDEPVKVCLAGGRIVDFHKRPVHAHDWHGESVGFFRFSAGMAAALAERTERYVAERRHALEYEEPLRDIILESPPDLFGYEDITGLPWTEIDFPEDIARAQTVVLPRLVDGDADASPRS